MRCASAKTPEKLKATAEAQISTTSPRLNMCEAELPPASPVAANDTSPMRGISVPAAARYSIGTSKTQPKTNRQSGSAGAADSVGAGVAGVAG